MRTGKRLRLILGMVALAIVLAACSNHPLPQNTLNPKGPYARTIDNLFDPVFWIAVGVFFVVEGLLVVALFKFRHRPGRETPPQIHGNNRMEIAWTIAPAVLLVAIAVPTVATVFDINRRPAGDALTVNVIGHQWWWEFDYPSLKITTANVLHIPVGRPAYLNLCSGGMTPSKVPYGGTCTSTPPPIGNAVIHSFWVGGLNGKQDVVPGRTNHLTLQADHPGVYSGQCAEFCGFSHGLMRLRVIAQTESDFDAWVAAQQRQAQVPTGGLALKGYNLVTGEGGETQLACVQCHTISGAIEGIGGPDLTHFASRDCFAGCILDNTPENVARWLADPPAVKDGSFMPNYHLSKEQIDALVAYLETLK